MAHGINAVRRMPTDDVGTLDLKPLAGKGSNHPGEQPACVLDGRQPFCKFYCSSAGIRGLACMGVLMGHVIYFVAQGAQDKALLYGGFKQKLWLNWALHAAEPSMDFFMVLTG